MIVGKKVDSNYGLFDGLDFSKIIAATLPAVVSTVGASLNQPEDKSLSFEQQKEIQAAALENAMKIAQLNAASAGAGSGAAVAAARITDARERQRIRLEAEQAMLSGRLRSLELMKPEVLANIMSGRAQVAQRGGEAITSGFNSIAQNLGGGYTRSQQPMFGRG